MAPAVGAFALATKLVGYFYGRAANAHGQCYGHHCFQCARVTFLVALGITAFLLMPTLHMLA